MDLGLKGQTGPGHRFHRRHPDSPSQSCSLARELSFASMGALSQRVDKAVGEIEKLKVDGVAADLTTQQGAEALFARVGRSSTFS